MTYARGMLDKRNQDPGHKGSEDPVAQVFGYAKGHKEGESRIGLLSFRDADILACPVPTMGGPRWITTPSRLEAAGHKPIKPLTDPTRVRARGLTDTRINLGWLLLEVEKSEDFGLPAGLAEVPGMKHVESNLVLVHDDLFPSLVNANLETRTSVSIDFETGAAAESLLFTYEATPRGTLFRGGIDFDLARAKHHGVGIDTTQQLLRDALGLACRLGLGGMTTRGFGRMQEHLMEDAR